MSVSIVDRLDYSRLKKIATGNLDAVMEWSHAVREIKERHLWKQEFDTWTEFCRVALKRSDGYVRLLLQGEELARSDRLLVEMGEKKEEDSAILQAKTVTDIKKAVKETVSERNENKADTNKDKQDSSPLEPRDNLGVVIPERCRPLWERNDEVIGLIHQLQSVKRVLDKVQADGKDPLWSEVKTQDAILEIRNAIRQLKNAVPYAVCPYCQGELTKTCSFCYHRGLVSQWRLDTADQDLVKMQMRKGQR